MPDLSFRQAASLLDPVRPPLRLRGSRGLSATQDRRIIHRRDKGLWQLLRWRPGTEPEEASLRSALDKLGACEPIGLLWYNTWLIQSWTDPFAEAVLDKRATAPKLTDRRGEIGDAIAEAGYAIAALCEVFKPDDGKELRKRTASRPGGDHRRGPEGTVDKSSGLETLTFSPVRIVSDGTREFWEEPSNFEWFASKGVLHTELDLGGGCRLDLYSTHLTAGGSAYDRERWEQVGELLRFVRMTHTPENVILIAGDFNFMADSKAYPTLIRKFSEYELLLVRDGGRLVNYYEYIGKRLGELSEQCRKAMATSEEVRSLVDAHRKRMPGVGLPFVLHAMLMEPNLDLVSEALDFAVERRPLRARDLWRYRGGWSGVTSFGDELSTNPLKVCFFDSERPTGYCDDYVDSEGRPYSDETIESEALPDGDRRDYLFLADPNELHNFDLNVARVRRRPFWRGERQEGMPADLLGVDPAEGASLLRRLERLHPELRAIEEQGRVPFYLSDHLGLEVLLIPSR